MKKKKTKYLVMAGVAAFLFLGGVIFYQMPMANNIHTPMDVKKLVISTNDPALIEMGQEVYQENCASCHGASLEGQENWRQVGSDGVLPAPPHDENGHTWHHPDGFLFAYTKLGGQHFMPSGRKSGMPAFEDILTDQEILASLSYIKSTWPTEILKQQARITRQTQDQ